MNWPQPSDYHDAIQAPRICFRDPTLKVGAPTLQPNGLPKVIAGNFASVYQLTSAGARYAVRCFLTYHADQARRYEAISADLTKLKLPFMVGFQFEQDGILIKGSWYPILRMEWVEGVGFNQYIESKLGEPRRLLELAERFIACVESLERNSIAHSDLQHGNILVQPDGSLKLIDYDGMYVPSLAGWGTHELGHAAYQHPRRDAQVSFGPYGDRFSAWVIAVSLMSLCTEPSLWAELNAGGDRLLFSQSDLLSPASSLAFARIDASANPVVRAAAHQLQDLLRMPPDATPALTRTLLSGLAVPDRVEHTPQYEPDEPTTGTPSWVVDHLESRPSMRFSGSFGIHRAAVWSVAGLLAVLLVLSTLGVAPAPIAASLAIASVTALTVVLAGNYRGRPERKEKVQETLRYRSARDRLRTAQAAFESAKRRRSDENKKEQAELKALADRLGNAGTRRDSEIARITAESQRATKSLQVDLAGLDRKRDDALAAALARLQADFYARALRAYSIDSASIPGIGDALKARLKTAGLVTAADLTGVRARQVNSGYRTYTREVTEVRVGSSWKQVDGVGPTKAQALAAWRKSGERIAEKSAPRQLPQAERDSIVARTEGQRRELSRRIDDVHQRLGRFIVEVRQAFSAEAVAIEAEVVRAKGKFARSYAELNNDIKLRGKEVSSAEYAEAKAKKELSRYSALTVRSYVSACLGFGG
jgi:hypothetical protein